MKPIIRIRGQHVNANQVEGYEQPTYRERKEPICKPGRDIREVIGYNTIRETILPVTVSGRRIILIGQDADQALEDLQ